MAGLGFDNFFPRLISSRTHSIIDYIHAATNFGALDYGVAAASSAFPKLLDLNDSAAIAFFYAQGGGETLIVGISDYDDNSGATRHADSFTRRYRDL